MSLVGLLLRNWKLVVVCCIIALLGAVGMGYLKHKSDVKALADLQVKCEKEWGRDNYVIGVCDYFKYCCVSKDDVKLQNGSSTLVIVGDYNATTGMINYSYPRPKFNPTVQT